MARKSTRRVKSGSGDVIAYVTKPLGKGGAEIKAAGCPQNQIVGTETEVIIARGCTEEEARRKVYRKLLQKARALRKAANSPCVGDCGDGGHCTLITPIDPSELTCSPADMPDCPDGVGYVCAFIGLVRAECVCAI
ncbi:hypothetical protein [Dongia sp. agr-C8]